jgi:hypothetical protein
MAYDSDQERVFLFGGCDGKRSLADWWILRLENSNYAWKHIENSNESFLLLSVFELLNFVIILIIIQRRKLVKK